jgi:hypothetical protein
MSTAVWIGKTRVKLGDADLLGVGGEGSVYAFRDRAVKVYHPAPAGDAPARARLDIALAKVQAFPRALPDAVVAPLDVARDDAGEPVGYAMRRVSGATEVARLASRGGGAPAADVLALFAHIHEVVCALHVRGVVLGDFNDANVLFAGTSPFFIDADSMQFARFPCVVAQERYLDPRLYGRDLSAAPAFSPETDWYAYAVMLFASLLHVHPYGGTHKALPTMLRRAEAGHSVLRDDVVYPRAATPFAVLPDDLLAYFVSVFDRGARAPLPASALRVRFSRCACGVEHARRACPACAKAAQVDVVADVARGGCRCATIVRTRGCVLSAEVRFGRLRWAVEEDGVVLRDDGTRVSRREHDAAAAEPFVVVDGWIVDVAHGTRVGQVLEGQTWLRAGERMGVGFYRTGSITEAFAFRTDRGGVARVALSGEGAVRPRDRIAECSACFDGETALLTLVLDRDGRRLHALHVVRADGSVIASACGAPDESPLFAAASGRCLAHGAILCPTDGGLLLTRDLVPAKTFPDTRPFVSQSSELLPGPGGSVYVIDQREIAHLSLR